jgi:hypothetical protein
MRHAWILIALAACKQGTGDDYPINPGGDDIGDFHPPIDASSSDQSLGDGSAMLTGRVCLLADLRAPNACANTGAGNITVQLGTVTTLTADDGMFSLIPPSGTNLTWRAGAADLVTSVVPLSASNILPIITADSYDDLLTTNGVILNSGQGSVVLFVRDAVGALSGAAVALAPTATYLPKHDTANKSVWVDGNTGPAGVSWTAGANAGAVNVTVTPPSGTAQQFTLPIADGAITYTTVVF